MGREISEEEKIGFIKRIIATGLFIGYLPIAPATFACLISIIIWYLLFHLKIVFIIVAVVLFFIGVSLSNSLAKIWGKDPHQIVIDEYATFLLPLYFTPRRILPLVITFILFRLFDIIKPPPIRRLEKLSGGWGIMLDDLLAAVYTTLIVVLIQSFHLL